MAKMLPLPLCHNSRQLYIRATHGEIKQKFYFNFIYNFV